MASPNELTNAAVAVPNVREPDALEQAKDEQPVTNSVVGSSGSSNRFIPYHCTLHNPTKGRYITSNDPRGFIPVYEYPLNGQWIMMDMDDGYILWTGIWKALGNHKADIVKMLESQPDLATQLRRVRGGYLKIQGTWLAYEVALRLARRVAWPIRHDLVPLFGPTFPTTCLSPDQPGYGTVIPSTGRRKPRRSLQSVGIPPPHSVPYPPQPPVVQDYAYTAPQVAGALTNPASIDPLADGARYRQLPQAAVDNGSLPFATPIIPPVPALIPTTSLVYSPQEPAGSSQYTASSTTCSPLRELPPKGRYSPYTLPRRNHSPSAQSGSYGYSSPLAYERPHHLMHRASEPNLRSYQSRKHLLVPRLQLNTHFGLPTRDLKHALHPVSAGAETGGRIIEESQRYKGREGDNVGISSGDSAHSSIHTSPFNEVASSAYDNSWSAVPPGAETDHWVEYAPVHYDQSTQYYADSTPSFSDPSNVSPRTTWSYEAYARHSPTEQHMSYPVKHSLHNHYSSLSSAASFEERRMSMADSIASAFPEPEMPIPQVAYHRYSQPQLYHPLPPTHHDMWMKERSGSFAEMSSYGPPAVMSEGVQHGYSESADMYASMPVHTYTPSPPSAHSPEQNQGSLDGSSLEDASHSQLINSETPAVSVW